MANDATTARFTCPIRGDEGEYLVDLEWDLTDPVGLRTQQAMAAGSGNTVNIPSGTTPDFVIIIPDTTTTETVTIKGLTGDTGIAIPSTEPTPLRLNSSVTSINVTLSAGTPRNFSFIWI